MFSVHCRIRHNLYFSLKGAGVMYETDDGTICLGVVFVPRLVITLAVHNFFELDTFDAIHFFDRLDSVLWLMLEIVLPILYQINKSIRQDSLNAVPRVLHL